MSDQPPELGYDHVALRTKVLQFRAVEKIVLSLRNQLRALGEDLPALALTAIDVAIEQLKPTRKALLRELPAIVKGSPLDVWISDTHGLGSGLWLLLGSMPPIGEFKTPAAVWKYTGLDVRDGKAPRRVEGVRLGFAPIRRAYAIMRVADPVVKVGGPYRESYDKRRAHTLETHPPMFSEGELADPGCEICQEAIEETEKLRAERNFTRERQAPAMDCANRGGVHWSDGHRHADAKRFVAKAILCDAWRVARGQPPRVGQGTNAAHTRQAAQEPTS